MAVRNWKVYHSDWQAEQFARLVDDNIAAVTELNWSDTGNLGEAVAAMNEMPQRDKVRRVHLVEVATGRRIALPVASNDAPLYSMGGRTLDYNGITYDVTGFSGERRSIAR